MAVWTRTDPILIIRMRGWGRFSDRPDEAEAREAAPLSSSYFLSRLDFYFTWWYVVILFFSYYYSSLNLNRLILVLPCLDCFWFDWSGSLEFFCLHDSSSLLSSPFDLSLPHLLGESPYLLSESPPYLLDDFSFTDCPSLPLNKSISFPDSMGAHTYPQVSLSLLTQRREIIGDTYYDTLWGEGSSSVSYNVEEA